MTSHPPFSLPYLQANATQLAQVLTSLRPRLRAYFPTLTECPLARALAELQPELRLVQGQFPLTRPAPTQLVQYLADAPELPRLDPPLYGPWALELAHYLLNSSELATAAITALAAADPTPCVAPLGTLLRHLTTPYPLAQAIVQAHCWNRPGSPRLPDARPSWGPAPGSLTLAELLREVAPPLT